jgi:hypothetical protein
VPTKAAVFAGLRVVDSTVIFRRVAHTAVAID